MGNDDSILILKGDELLSLLTGLEEEIMNRVRAAYVAHWQRRSSLPFSTFLRFPEHPENRIIGLPAYLGDGFEVAGIKWISSFPKNTVAGKDRASAVIVLNSLKDGRPEAILEGSVISARRTAASAALAAKHLRVDTSNGWIGLLGCGAINFEVVRFLSIACPEQRRLLAFDLDPDRAFQFKRRCESALDLADVRVARSADEVFEGASVISIATTTLKPHIHSVIGSPPGTVILHVSLRDLMPQVILSCDNIVDDIDHVCRSETSVHLAEQLKGTRSFIRGTLAEVLTQAIPPRTDPPGTVVFSPFGLGVLDIAIAKLACELAQEKNRGCRIEGFLPEPWDRATARSNSAV